MSTKDLDADQVIKKVYDPPTESLKVNATVVAQDITLIVEIDQADDSILVYGQDSGGTNRAIRTDTDGELQVDVLSSALPTGAATSAKQDVGNTSLANIDGHVDVNSSTRASESTLSTLNNKFISGTDIGDVTVNNASGASAVNIQDGGNSITIDGSVSVSNFPATVAVTQSTSPWVVSGTVISNIGTTGGLALDSTVGGLLTNTQLRASPVPISGTVTANAGTGNFTVVQATGSNLHTVIDNGTITTITNVVHIDDNGGSITVDGPLTDIQLRATPVPISGTIAATQSGTWNINNISGTVSLPTGAATEASLAKLTQTQGSTTSGQSGTLIQGAVTTAAPTYTTGQTSPLSITTTGLLRVDTSSATGTVTVNNGAGASAVNIQDGGNSITVDGSVTVTQATGTNLHTVIDSGTITTVTNLSQLAGNAISMNTGVRDAGTQRVTIATNDVVPVTDNGSSLTVDNSGTFAVQAAQSGTWNITNISGTVSLPTGASTETTLAALNAKFNSLGQKTMANSVPVVIASDQTSVPVTDSGGSLTVDNTGTFAVQAAQSGTWSTRLQDGSGNAITSTTLGAKQILDVNATIADSVKQTYSASAVGFVAALLATDVFVIVGSASKTIKVTRVQIDGTTSAGSGLSINLQLLKRSTANTGGTFVADTAVPHDSTNAAATATVGHYTANPTTGTLVGAVRSSRFDFGSTGGQTQSEIWDFGSYKNQAVTLRGITQSLALNFNGATITGSIVDITIEWTEES